MDKRDYRRTLKEIVETRRGAGGDISFSKLATACRIQRTFLSQVMNHKHHLSNDQLYAVCRELNLGRDESRHLQLISEWERCKNKQRKAFLERKLRVLEGDAMPDSGRRISGANAGALDDYFCDPLAESVLKFMTIKRFRDDPELIKTRLGLRPERWQEIVRSLEDGGMIRYQKGRIEVLKQEVHPAEESAAEKLRNIQGRIRVSEQKLKQRDIDEFMYNWWFISNPEGKKRLKIELLHLLQNIHGRSRHTPHTDVYQLSLDLLTP